MRKILICAAAGLMAAGCSDGGTTPSVATTVTLSPTAVTLTAVGATQVVHATVVDQKGKAMPGAALSWSSSTAGVTVAGAGGDSAVVTAAANGPATVTASSGGASGSLAVQVTQDPATVQKTGGDGQSGAAGTALATPLQVTVRDRLGAPVPGVTVAFATDGGGTLSPLTATTGANGVAATAWTLGTTAGTEQKVTASAANLAPVQFSVTATAGPPATATAFAGNGQGATPGTAVAVAPTVVVRDAFNNPVSGVAVQFTVTAGGGAVTGATRTTDAGGAAAVGSWTLGAVAGTNTLTATFPGTALAAVVFTATGGSVGTIARTAGDNQAGMAGSPLTVAPSVVVRDPGGNPLAGRTVNFVVTAGGGTVGNATAVTNASGVATAGSWVLGPAAGPNTVTASVTGLVATPATFRATGCSGGGGAGFGLTLCFTTAMSTSQRAAFQDAAAKWAQVITGDVADVSGSVPAGTCGPTQAAMNMNFDDLVIFATIQDIDGPGQVLGSAGPCLIRNVGNLPILGIMRFDAADVANLEAGNGFAAVILHEMGHVLGIGTLWDDFGLLQDASSAGTPRDTWFSGANGIAGFNSIGGSTYTGGQKVPVENTGGAGTMNGHWRESVLGRELMTGFLNSGVPNPLSLLTVRSLSDMGYTVNTGAAESFSVSFSLQGSGPSASRQIRLHNDVWNGPRLYMDRAGRISRERRASR
jgi:hypothetical protein